MYPDECSNYFSELEGKMKVSLDGGETYQDAPNGVRVIYDVIVDDEDGDGDGELHINLTDEGIIIMDVWSDENHGTNSETTDEIVERLT